VRKANGDALSSSRRSNGKLGGRALCAAALVALQAAYADTLQIARASDKPDYSTIVLVETFEHESVENCARLGAFGFAFQPLLSWTNDITGGIS
jgi:hypothetical protein